MLLPTGLLYYYVGDKKSFILEWYLFNLWVLFQVARILMKTLSQLGSGKNPVGTTAYMGRIEHLMQCKCDVLKGTT